ncbi:hypothetical protein F5Y14DRAFT_236303 [Nemania sp. NC0429]|nr:hypothetical protein F5Y14DRAFT_236303 [Nemania sp. NC0429]
MAAKARGISSTDSFLVKRNARLRQRVMLRTPLIPTQITEGSGLKRDSMFSPHTYGTVFSKTTVPVGFLPCPKTLRSYGLDVDTAPAAGVDTGVDCDDPWLDTTESSSSSACYLADLSNYLGASHSDSDVDMVTQSLDPEPTSRQSLSSTDSYGWENILLFFCQFFCSGQVDLHIRG